MAAVSHSVLAPVLRNDFDSPNIARFVKAETEEPEFFKFAEGNALHDASGNGPGGGEAV